MHNTECRFVIGRENVLFCRRVHAHFSPVMFQDVAVKRLIFSTLLLRIMHQSQNWGRMSYDVSQIDGRHITSAVIQVL